MHIKIMGSVIRAVVAMALAKQDVINPPSFHENIESRSLGMYMWANADHKFQINELSMPLYQLQTGVEKSREL